MTFLLALPLFVVWFSIWMAHFGKIYNPLVSLYLSCFWLECLPYTKTEAIPDFLHS